MGKRTVGIISGGSGSSKFATALANYNEVGKHDFAYICNVGDNFFFHGLYVCPDVDIITYALAGILDERKSWGIKEDTWNFVEGLAALGYGNWFSLGDRDLALCVVRTELINGGLTLSQATDRLRKYLGIKNKIVPATDDSVQTFVDTSKGRIHLQEYWVKMKGALRVSSVDYRGIKNAMPNREVLMLLSKDVLILPANPITSVMPTVSLRGVRKKLRMARVTAISPFIGKSVFSGPAAKLMRAMHIEPSSYGVAKLYSDFLKLFIVDYREENSEIVKIKDFGIECIKSNIKIDSIADKRHIARELMNIL